MRLASATVERCRSREGALAGRFRLGRLLGIGASAAVYEATREDGRQVALKVLHHELRTSKEVHARLARQHEVSQRIEHPGVLRVCGLETTAADTMLVMERLEGETLDARRRRSSGALDARSVVRWTIEVLDALEAVHARGIVHRDVKPANVFLRHDGAPVLIDFGSALVNEGGSMTRTGQYLGTPAFMPPELANGHPHDADARSDLWSLAATVFFSITGEIVHPARSPAQQLLYAATQPARSLRTLRPDLDPKLGAAVDRALRFDPKDRFASAAAFGDALRSVLGA